MRLFVISLVSAVHVTVIGGALLIQGCGTTRGPVEFQDQVVMPPSDVEQDRRITPAEPVPLRRPASIEESAARFKQEQPPTRPKPPAPVGVAHAGETYVVGQGDTLSAIALRFRVPMSEIMVLNNISNPDRIHLGQELKLPAKVSDPTPRPAPAPRAPSRDIPEDAVRYEVRSGDSLSMIAFRYGTTVKAIQELNGITGDRILVGQELFLPPGSRLRRTESRQPSAPQPRTEPEAATEENVVTPPLPTSPLEALAPEAPVEQEQITYTVQAGDSILDVASAHNVSIVDLRRVNQLTSSDRLIPGQTLVIPTNR